MAPIDMHELIARGPQTNIEKLRIELYNRINQLGIGAQGLGGLTTVLNVKALDCPTHAANLPVAMIPNCAATRHLHIRLDGSGPVSVAPPSLDAWPRLTYAPTNARRVNLAAVTREDIQTWKPGEVILLTGSLLTGRDAAHKRLTDMLNRGETLPVDLRGRFLYYVGPVEAVRDEAVGPAGPTTATRMDKFTRQVLAQTGLLGTIGKAERGPEAIAAIREFHSVYLIAVGGAAYLISRPSTPPASSPSPTSAWKPSTSSMSSTCPSPSPSTPPAPASTPPAPPSGNPASPSTSPTPPSCNSQVRCAIMD